MNRSKKFVSVEDFQKLQDQVKNLSKQTMQSRDLPPPPPPSRPLGLISATQPPPLYPSKNTARAPPPPMARPANSPTTSPATLPKPASSRRCNYPGCSGSGCDHNYEEVQPGMQLAVQVTQDHHTYEKLVFEDLPEGKDINSRLERVERNQKDILTAINLLQETLLESNSQLKEAVKEVQFKFLETSDHLGQQILHIRRDVLGSSNKAASSSIRSLEREKMYKHSFKWEVPNVDNLAKVQKQTSSPSYQISQINFKVIGTATASRDGRLHVRMFGDFTHFSENRRGGRFNCTVNAVDPTGNQLEMVVGKLAGDFNQEKEWTVGEVSIPELRRKGYIEARSDVLLRFDFEVYA